MESASASRRYMAGDVIRLELVLEHAMNLSRVFVAFSHESEPLTEFYFESTSFPESGQSAGVTKRSRMPMEAAVSPETTVGVYRLDRINVFSVGGKLARLRSEEQLVGVSEASFEVIEEPGEVPMAASLDFLG